ncbi:MAG: hypothetical protein ACJ74Q_15400 [Pyrinomonadaceae bacterium]
MTLIELMKKIASANPELGVEEFFDATTGGKNEEAINRPHGDGLAKFVAVEVIETFDEGSGTESQLDEARSVLEGAIEDLTMIVNALLKAGSSQTAASATEGS